jgi:hypothetical protein
MEAVKGSEPRMFYSVLNRALFSEATKNEVFSVGIFPTTSPSGHQIFHQQTSPGFVHLAPAG